MYYEILGALGLIMLALSALLHRSTHPNFRKNYEPCSLTSHNADNNTIISPNYYSFEHSSKKLFPEIIRNNYEKSLKNPCQADFYIEAWYGIGSKLNIYTILLVDVLLANKTASVWIQRDNPRLSQLAITLKETFNNDVIPLCVGDTHNGTFHNDQSNFQSYKKQALSYNNYLELLSRTMIHLFDNINDSYTIKAQHIIDTIPLPFYTVHVRWGNKIFRESTKVSLQTYVNIVKKKTVPKMIFLMSTVKGVRDDFAKRSGIRTVNYHDDILTEIMVASKSELFIGSESSNIFRIIYKLRKGHNMHNVEDLDNKRKNPIRIWLSRWRSL